MICLNLIVFVYGETWFGFFIPDCVGSSREFIKTSIEQITRPDVYTQYNDAR